MRSVRGTTGPPEVASASSTVQHQREGEACASPFTSTRYTHGLEGPMVGALNVSATTALRRSRFPVTSASRYQRSV